MANRILLSAGRHNLEECVEVAKAYHLGIEIMTFAYPDVLDGDCEGEIERHQALLHDVPGPITMHGPFMDMAPGSPDRRINMICEQRYKHAIRIASILGAQTVVFHANFIAAIHNVDYRLGWQRRNVDFWRTMADYAYRHQVTLAMENMWEFDPNILGDVLRAVDHPSLRACLDVGHAHLFSDDTFRFEDWLAVLHPWIVHLHVNNNNGRIDVHHSLHDGVVDYKNVFRRINSLPITPPTTVLEMDHVEDMIASLDFFHLESRQEVRPELETSEHGSV